MFLLGWNSRSVRYLARNATIPKSAESVNMGCAYLGWNSQLSTAKNRDFPWGPALSGSR